MKIVVSFIAGAIFSVGLSVSGMINPNIVIGFLDIFGEWNYSLAFVMCGAVIFNLISFRFILKRTPIFNSQHLIPSKKDIDKNLIIGSALFGIGWGVLGICPGPGLVNLGTLDPKIFVFVLAMALGMIIQKRIS